MKKIINITLFLILSLTCFSQTEKDTVNVLDANELGIISNPSGSLIFPVLQSGIWKRTSFELSRTYFAPSIFGDFGYTPATSQNSLNLNQFGIGADGAPYFIDKSGLSINLGNKIHGTYSTQSEVDANVPPNGMYITSKTSTFGCSDCVKINK